MPLPRRQHVAALVVQDAAVLAPESVLSGEQPFAPAVAGWACLVADGADALQAEEGLQCVGQRQQQVFRAKSVGGAGEGADRLLAHERPRAVQRADQQAVPAAEGQGAGRQHAFVLRQQVQAQFAGGRKHGSAHVQEDPDATVKREAGDADMLASQEARAHAFGKAFVQQPVVRGEDVVARLQVERARDVRRVASRPQGAVARGDRAQGRGSCDQRLPAVFPPRLPAMPVRDEFQRRQRHAVRKHPQQVGAVDPAGGEGYGHGGPACAPSGTRSMRRRGEGVA